MMKNKNFFVLLALLPLMFFTVCDDVDRDFLSRKKAENSISVSEAKAFFEETVLKIGQTGQDEELTGLAFDFTPQWDRTVISGNDSMVAVDVAILSNQVFKAAIPAGDDMPDSMYLVNTLQKLTVVKNLRTGGMSGYVATIIPSKEYVLEKRGNLTAKTFPNYDTPGKFSGWILYSLPLGSNPVRVNLYRDGRLVDEASYFGQRNDDEAIKATLNKVRSLLAGVSLYRQSKSSLRGGDYSDREGGELEEFVCIGHQEEKEFEWDWLDIDPPCYSCFVDNGMPSYDPTGGGYGGYDGGGDSGGSPTSTLSAAAQSIMNNNNLDNNGKNNLNAKLADMLNQCGYQYAYNYVSNKGYAFSNVTYNPNQPDAGRYNPTTRGLTFQNAGTIASSLPEEFAHLYQDAYYPGGTSQYFYTSKANIEFEAKLMVDILCYIKDSGCQYSGATFANNASYQNWLHEITNDGTKIPSYSDLTARYSDALNCNYWDFLNDYANNSQEPVNTNLLPNSLTNLGNSPCY